MTTTIVYGDVADGYLNSGDATYAGARTGPADGVNTGTSAFYGQNNNGGTYTVFQTFIRFAYPAVAAGDVVTSAVVQTYQLSQLSTGTVRDLELWGAPWGTSLATADWRTPTQLSSTALFGLVRGVQASQGKWTSAGSESLRSGVKASSFQEFVLVSSRQRAGSTPTTDEGASIATADQTGTSSDPRLVFTTVPDSRLIPVMGAEAQLSDGSWAFLTMDGATGTVTLWREDLAALAFNLGNHVTGTGAGDWYNVPAAQGLTLTVDTLDNIYVVGRAGDAPNSIRVRAYVKAPGSWSWTAGAIRTATLPTHDSPVNNVTCAWSPAAGGTLMVFAAHAAGDGVSGGNANDVVWVAFDSVYLRGGTGGTLVRGSGSATSSSILPADGASDYFSGYLNETGSGLDVVMDTNSTHLEWGYVASLRRAQALGANGQVAVGRFNFNSPANGFDFTDQGLSSCFGTKDASAKIRVLLVGAGQVAVVSADADAGYGLSVQVLQHSGNVAGWVSLGYVHLGGESIPSMPDGPAVKVSLAWDAVYSAAENAVWVYYVDKANANRVMRTPVDMNTYQATRAEVQVYLDATYPILAVRAPRNAKVTQIGHVTVATQGGYQRILDTFNLPPLAPVLNPKANYDATAAATFAWTFQDPNTGDTQSAYQLQVVRVSDGVTVLDTGKVLSVTASRSVAGGTLANGVDYRWRVMTWDQSGLTGSPWSNYGTFTTSAAGSVNITAPAADNPPGAATDDISVTWSVTGTVQAKYRAWVTRGDTGATVHDSGWVTSTAATVTVTGMVSDVEHTIRVQVENASAIRSGTGTRLITPSYGTPEVPLVTLTPLPEDGYVLVTVDNPPPGGPVTGFPEYRFETDVAALTSTSNTITWSTEQAHQGVGSAKHVVTANPAFSRIKSAEAALFTVVPGDRYTARYWVFAPVAGSFVATINWRPTDPAGTTISTNSGGATAVPANEWTLVQVTAVAPAGAVHAVYGPGFSVQPAVGFTFHVDELTMTAASDRPDVARNRIFRRPVGSTGPWEVLGETGPDGSFRDYTVPSHVPAQYLVRGESA